MHARQGYHLPVLLLLLLTCGQGADSLLCSCNDHNSCLSLPSSGDSQSPSFGNDTLANLRLRTTKVCSIGPEGQCYTSKTYQPNLEKGIGHGSYVVSFGCISNEEHHTLHCRSSVVPQLKPQVISCCNNTELCNAELDPQFPVKFESDLFKRLMKEKLWSPDGKYRTTTGNHQPVATQVVLLVSVCISVVVITLLILFLWYHYRHRLLQQLQDKTLRPSIPALPEDARELLSGLGMTSSGVGLGVTGASMTSGSGSGPPILVQRTISKQIQLVERIGRGRFGEVWRGQWRGDDLAVKIFHTSEEASWYRESQLYQSVTLRHDHVLGFIASDVKGSGAFTQLFLITEYHALGSLLNFLRTSSPLSPRRLLRMMHSLATGVNYLHTEIAGSRGKPAVAHRDLKSTNVLVKMDYTLCVADLGLAICQCEGSGGSGSMVPSLPPPPQRRGGTRRYMAPELLERELAVANGLSSGPPLSFEAYKKADIYALGLVFWEMCFRTQWPDLMAPLQQHQLPYAGFLESTSETPTVETLVRLVCSEMRRPTLPAVKAITETATGASSRYYVEVEHLLAECWCDNPDARLPALRVKKTLSNLVGRRGSKTNAGVGVSYAGSNQGGPLLEEPEEATATEDEAYA